MYFSTNCGYSDGTNCAPLVGYLFSFYYERDFMMSLPGDKKVLNDSNSTFRYLDDLLNIDDTYVHQIPIRTSLT